MDTKPKGGYTKSSGCFSLTVSEDYQKLELQYILSWVKLNTLRDVHDR